MIDFEFSEYQELLQNAARQFMVETWPLSHVREMEVSEAGYSLEIWREMANLGWLGMALPEEFGGEGGTFVDLIILLEESGRVLLPSPIIPSVVLGGFSILKAGSEKQKMELLPKIARGESIVTFAVHEPESWWDLRGIKTQCDEKEDEYVITGDKLFVPYAQIADYIICVATRRGNGLGLFLVDGNAGRMEKNFLNNIASEKLFEVKFNHVAVNRDRLIESENKEEDLINNLMHYAAVAKCGEMIGGARQVKEMCIEYAKQRKQFGRPIGSFQAIQHHVANIAVELEGARLVTYQAAWMLDDGARCVKEVAAAKAWTNEAYKRIVGLGHQIHGGYSITVDHDMQLYFRRAKAAELAFGDTNYYLKVLGHELVV